MCKYGACVWPACEQVSRCASIAFTCFLNCLAPPSFTATPHNGRITMVFSEWYSKNSKEKGNQCCALQQQQPPATATTCNSNRLQHQQQRLQPANP